MQSRVQAAVADEVDGPAEDARECLFQVQQVERICFGRGQRQQIDVGVRPVVAACGRAEGRHLCEATARGDLAGSSCGGLKRRQRGRLGTRGDRWYPIRKVGPAGGCKQCSQAGARASRLSESSLSEPLAAQLTGAQQIPKPIKRRSRGDFKHGLPVVQDLERGDLGGEQAR